ncbi:60S ribosomal protein L5, putative [Leishmania tarentolae]|uniref:60S ribosomal protein L5, putative n=1 Tax=Leishmania tarentolae TaxID=5689 RepID=A0A640KSH1_LEITA|nr:60S ribosomal protein L5, putative [Leishmania tarentolae]
MSKKPTAVTSSICPFDLLAEALADGRDLRLRGGPLLRAAHLLCLVALVRDALLLRLLRQRLRRVRADRRVRLLVHALNALRQHLRGHVLRELHALLVGVRARLLLHLLQVLRNVLAKDAVAEHLRVQQALLLAVAGEAVGAVRHSHTAVHHALQHAEHAGTGRRARKANVQDRLEREALLVIVLVVVLRAHSRVRAVRLLHALELIRDAKLRQRAARQQQTRRVRSSVVCQAVRNTERGQLVRVRGHQNLVAHDLRLHDLRNDVLVRDAHNKAVLGRAELRLVLQHHLAARVVVRLSLAATAVLHLEALEVRLVLHNLDERHLECVGGCLESL